MSRPVTRLSPELMSDAALWRAAFRLVGMMRCDSGYSLKEVDRLLDELDRVLSELHLRGEQLSLPFEPDPPAAA